FFMVDSLGFHPAFAVAGVGMIVSVAILGMFRRFVEAPRAPFDFGLETALSSWKDSSKEGSPPAITDPPAPERRTQPTPPGPASPRGSAAVPSPAPPPPYRNLAIEAVPDWMRVSALLVIFGIVIVFWMVFHQNGSTLTYWAKENTRWSEVGLNHDPKDPKGAT